MKPAFALASVLCATLALLPSSLVAPAAAQQSASYKMTESTFNAGGDPLNGASAASASFRIRLDALGDAVVGVGGASASFHMDAGFADVYAPPGEVRNQRFTNASSMTWDADKTAGVYEVYRGALGSFPGGFGTCFQSSIAGPAATDATVPALGQGWFYIATAKNRLGEEGTKGHDSGNTMRPNNAPCP
jgi:hypothetical protein